MTDLNEARAFLAEQRAARVGEFALTRGTPSQDESDRMAEGEVVMLKRWDLSPVDPQSFDPTEPPGRPTSPPTNTVAPVVTAVPNLTEGSAAVVSNGTWTGSPTLARQWKRGATNVGTGGTSYTFVAADVGAMISCDVTGTNAGGSLTVSTNAVGPIVAAAQEPENGDDGETVHPTRRKR